MGVVGNVTPPVSTEPATVGVILQRLPISKEMTSFGSCDEGS